jgi:hypothetical protein
MTGALVRALEGHYIPIQYCTKQADFKLAFRHFTPLDAFMFGPLIILCRRNCFKAPDTDMVFNYATLNTYLPVKGPKGTWALSEGV